MPAPDAPPHALRALLLAAASRAAAGAPGGVPPSHHVAAAQPPPPPPQSRELQDAVRAVQADASDMADRARKIHELFMKRREDAIRVAAGTATDGEFPGKGARAGCEHYERKCWIRAKCCGKFYACRRCHDENEDHEIDRHATEEVGCVECGEAPQPVAKECRACGVEFARYFCAKCKFYDDTQCKEAYHCDGCGICRVGKGLGIDNHHCNGCNSCVPIDHKDSHPCRERSLDANCPICAHYLATSTEPVVFMLCGHTMHKECLTQHTASRYTCPICNKCLTDMKDWYKAMDERIAQDTIPAEFARRVSRVLCHDCGDKTVVPFHFAYHKCGSCGAYNTRVLEQFDRADTPEAVPPPGGGGGGGGDVATADDGGTGVVVHDAVAESVLGVRRGGLGAGGTVVLEREGAQLEEAT